MKVEDLNLIYHFGEDGVHRFYFVGQLKVEYFDKGDRDCLRILKSPNELEKMTLETIDLRQKNETKKTMKVGIYCKDADKLGSAIEFFKEPKHDLKDPRFAYNSNVLLEFIKMVVYR